MRKLWFQEWGWIYYPTSWQGTFLTFLALAFCLQVFLAVDRKSHSVSDTLYGIFPFVVPIFLGWLWVAGKTSRFSNQ